MMFTDTAGIYVHIPFCDRKCGYCDFYSITNPQLITHFAESVIHEINIVSPRYRSYPFETVFFGGGTPSVLPAGLIQRIWEALQNKFSIMETGEFTIEANPESLDRNKLEHLRQMGFNRLSLGIQSFNEEDLRFLGRIHDVQQAVDAFEMARQSGFHNINLDLMTAFPGLTPAKFSNTLGRAVSLQPEHISCYSLIFEKGTPFYHQMKSGKFSPPSDDEEKEYDEMVQEILSRNGYTAYEISNFARSSDSYCRHNLKYWNHHSYLGFGPSAHTFVKPKRWSNIRALAAYIEKLAEDILPISDSESLNESQLEFEYIFLHLRLKDGIDMHEYQRRFGKDFTSSYSETIRRFTACGMIGILDNRLFLTSKGWLLADEIAAAF